MNTKTARKPSTKNTASGADRLTGWRPIAKAPKTGIELVVTDFKSPPEFAAWVESPLYLEGGYWRNRDGRRREMPTHFVELPEAAPCAR